MTRLLTIILVFVAMDSCISEVKNETETELTEEEIQAMMMTNQKVETELRAHIEFYVNTRINKRTEGYTVILPFISKIAEGHYFLHTSQLQSCQYARIVVEHLGVASTELGTVPEKDGVVWSTRKLAESVREEEDLKALEMDEYETVKGMFDTFLEDEEIVTMLKPFPNLTTKFYSFTKYKNVTVGETMKLGDYIAVGFFVWRKKSS